MNPDDSIPIDEAMIADWLQVAESADLGRVEASEARIARITERARFENSLKEAGAFAFTGCGQILVQFLRAFLGGHLDTDGTDYKP